METTMALLELDRTRTDEQPFPCRRSGFAAARSSRGPTNGGGAPTTSTTATLALADALAIALLDQKGLSDPDIGIQNFGILHPGCEAIPIVDMKASTADAILEMNTDLLARRACEAMTAEPRSVRPQALAAEALALMNQAEMLITVIFVAVDRRSVGILHIHDRPRFGVA